MAFALGTAHGNELAVINSSRPLRQRIFKMLCLLV